MAERTIDSGRRRNANALLWHFLRSYPGRSLAVVALLSLAGLAEGVSVLSLLPFVQIALAGHSAPMGRAGAWITHGLEAVGLQPTLGVLLALIVVGITGKAAVSLVAMKEAGFAVSRLMTDLRHRLVGALMAARWSYFVARPLGVFANAIGAETISAGNTYQLATKLAAAVIQAAVYGAATVIMSWKLALFAMVTGLFGVLVFRKLIASARKAGGRHTEVLRSLSARITDTLQGIKAIKAMGAEGCALPLLDREIAELDAAEHQRVWSMELFRVAQEPMLILFMALGLYGMVTFSSESMPTLMVVAVLFYRLFNRFQLVQEIYQQIAGGESTYWAVYDLGADAEADTERSPGALPAPEAAPGIQFESIAYAYGENPVLRGLSLTVEPGEFLVVSGASGGGKTTLLDILCGLLQPAAGRVRIDGVDLGEIDLRAWRARLGYVPQEMLLLHDTVLRNVTLGDESISRAEAEAALRAAGIWDHVAGLPAGLDTPVGERGGRFSGGQRQRISLARALVRRPAVLILDEITAALDKDTEREVCATLRNLAGGMTIIAVSHQTEMARIADRTVRVEAGVLEHGSAMPAVH